ncbi:MAG TPA: hypothetical protein VHW01_01225 [Polyangiaceae bacterium]|nr:hypothetical protein [Polyangiaceae bacterium]
MAKRRTPKTTDVRTDAGDIKATQESIEAELAALQEGLERLKAQLAERRRLDAAVRALTGLPKRKPTPKPNKAQPRRKPKTPKGSA